MSRKIRIGKDITLRWRVLTDFEPKPLSGRNLLLYLTDPFGLIIPLDFAVTGNNLISATYPGKDQVKLGRYILTLAENKGLDGSTVVDVIDAFTLVARTAYEGGSTGCHNLTLETIDLEGNLVTGGRGMSAYEVWLSQGHVGSEADFLLSLIGKDGIGIVKIEQIETSSESSGVNRIRITLSNGTSEDFIVRNGAKGDKMTYVDLTEADKKDLYEGASEVMKPLLASKQNTLTDTDGSYGQRVAELEKGKQDTLTAGNGISIKGGVISSTVDSLITPITYAELVALRDSSSLVAGMQYRITDYDFTTTKEDTDSAHQLFDIIVTADSESVLNEIARAVHHQYETSEETLTGAIKLYKTDMNGYANEVDTGDYFLLVGTVEVNGVTYYRYDKYEDGANTGRYILLESIDLDSLGVGLDNPLYPVGEGTYGEDGSYVSHSEDAIVAYENGTVTVGSVAPLSNRDIASWELKYTLENTKHSSTDGKGTILWMKDEFRNECNYDFINALFKVYEITACAESPSLVGTYAIKTFNTPITYGTNSKLVSTFGSNNHDNIIKYDGLAKIVLGNNCFSNTFGNNCFSNTFENNCFSNTFGNSCSYNTFGNSCSYNTFGNSCNSNTFGNSCNSNTFGNDCSSNTFGNSCNSNTFGNPCSNNTFGNNCFSNTFENNCFSNTFGNSCSYNTFGNSCSNNTFGNSCDSNTFGNSCSNNTFGNNCFSNTFGNSCDSNTFGNSCYSNSFGNYCYYIKFASSSSATTKYNYYRQNHFGNGCQFILFKGAETASDSAQVQNYKFAQRVQGTSSAYLTIDGVRSRAYETKVAKNSSGELKIYCEADLIQ